MTARGGLLLVDDEKNILQSLQRSLRNEQYEIYTALNAAEALDILENNKIDVVISDQRMPQVTGSELLTEVKKKNPNTVRIMLSGYSDFDAAIEAINNGSIYKFISKPWDEQNLKTLVREAFEYYDFNWGNLHQARAFERAFEAIMITDDSGVVLSVNSAFNLITEYASQEVIDKKFELIQQEFNSKEILEEIDESLEQRSQWLGKITLCKKNGDAYRAWLSVTPITDSDDQIKEYCYSFIDIADENVADALEEQHTHYDLLTGLPTRFYFLSMLENKIAKAIENKASFILLVIDLNRFNEINNTLGIVAGDALLKTVSVRLKDYLANTDEVIARIGDDEFALTFTVNDNKNDYKEYIQAILSTFEKPFNIENKAVYVSCKIGVVYYPSDANTAMQLLQNASLAAEHVKRNIKSNYYIYNADCKESDANKYQLSINDLYDGIKYNEFVLFYQPEISLNQGTIVGFEVFLRWNHVAYGLLTPNYFLQLAERSELIVSLGEWTIRNACKQLKSFENSGINNLNISINCSILQLLRGDFLEFIQGLIIEEEIQAEKVELEFTDCIFLMTHAGQDSVLQKVKDFGVKIALNLNALHRGILDYLNMNLIDRVKFSPLVIEDLVCRDKNTSLFAEILWLAEKQNVSSVVVGVETLQQLKFIKKYKIKSFQGDCICPPKTEAEFTKWLTYNKDENILLQLQGK